MWLAGNNFDDPVFSLPETVSYLTACALLIRGYYSLPLKLNSLFAANRYFHAEDLQEHESHPFFLMRSSAILSLARAAFVINM